MAIVINGSGTVTGLAVGGLPDGTVDSDTIATGTIVNADINDLAASKLTGALPAISGASLTGVTHSTSDVITAGQNWSGVTYTDTGAVGSNPTAKIYPDGTIVGSTDNGSYVKYPNGILECWFISTSVSTTDTTEGGLYYKEISLNYPVAMTTFGASTGIATKSGYVTWVQNRIPSNYLTLVTVRVVSVNSVGNAYLGYRAIGQWK
jgi:hypothetical protein